MRGMRQRADQREIAQSMPTWNTGRQQNSPPDFDYASERREEVEDDVDFDYVSDDDFLEQENYDENSGEQRQSNIRDVPSHANPVCALFSAKTRTPPPFLE